MQILSDKKNAEGLRDIGIFYYDKCMSNKDAYQKMRRRGGLYPLQMSRRSFLIQVKKKSQGNGNYFTLSCSLMTFSSYTIVTCR